MENRKIKILSTEWDLVYDKECCEISGVSGVTLPEKQKIILNPDLNDNQAKLCIIHESLHAIFDCLGYKELYGDEKLVYALSEALNITFDIKLKGNNREIFENE